MSDANHTDAAGDDTADDAVDRAAAAPADRDVPDWEDEYLDRVSDRLMFNYDLEKDRTVVGERFALYGEMRMESKKHFFHPVLSFAHHEAREHLFARRVDALDVTDLERLVEVGHDLADEWIDADEEHYGTEFTFALVAPELTDDVRSFVSGFRDRTLIRYGYFGHYEINFVVVAPEHEELVVSESADVGHAFAIWESIEPSEPGLLDLVRRRLQL